METLGDLLTRERRSDDLAVRVPGDPSVAYSYHDFVTTAWKTGNYFRRLGVHEDAMVGVVDDAAAPAVLALFGAAQNGGVTRFGPPSDVEAKVLVGPDESVLSFDPPAGAQLTAYGDVPGDPTVSNLGRGIWSENPAFPDTGLVDSETVALATGNREITHGELLEAADEVVADGSVAAGDVVAVREPLTRPGVVVAGVVAPLLAGATVLFPDDESVGDVAVADGDVPEKRAIEPPLS